MLKKPYIGILQWSWLSYMNPHRLAYGFAYSLPFAQITAIVLLVSMLFSKQKKMIPMNFITVSWIFFVLFMGVTTIFAFFPDAALLQYIKVIKIQVIIFLTMMLITDMQKLRQLIWVVVLSIGFFSIKGGVFTLITGGRYRVWGPPNSFITGNNELAIAVLMIIPLMVYLRQTTEIKWVRHGILFAIVTSVFTVLGTQSRGALLAIAAVGFFYWVKSDSKIISGFMVVILTACLLAFMPESWYDRMETIQTYEQDSSAMGRLNAWEYAFHAANARFLGMGFDSWDLATFALYAPNPFDVHAAHSIYFSVLADHGWIGLLLFLLIFYLSWRSLSKLVKSTHNNDQYTDINLLCRMLQVSFIAYFSGGAFLSLSYFDLPWHLVSFVVLIKLFFEKQKNSISIVNEFQRKQI